MKTLNEKEKKLQEVLNKLQVLNLQSYDQIENYEFLKSQKNQLEIEKQELENKFNIYVCHLSISSIKVFVS